MNTCKGVQFRFIAGILLSVLQFIRIIYFINSFSLGTDKSSIFVAMCILIQQLRLEKKVDVCTTTRKLRAQRHLMIDSYVSISKIKLETFIFLNAIYLLTRDIRHNMNSFIVRLLIMQICIKLLWTRLHPQLQLNLKTSESKMFLDY